MTDLTITTILIVKFLHVNINCRHSLHRSTNWTIRDVLWQLAIIKFDKFCLA